MKRQRIHLAILSALILLPACNRHSTPTKWPHTPGDEAFVSQPPSGSEADRTLAGGTNPGTQNGTGTGTTTTRNIIEADIYKVVGNTLFVLNTYRGLQVIDVTDLTAPKLLTRVPIVGTPIDLYVVNGTAYVAVSDYFWYGIDVQAGAAADTVIPYRGSQVWAVDVNQPATPKVLGRLPIDGDLDQTRIVGNVLYVESRHWGYWEWQPGSNNVNQDLTYVASFDISDPHAMKPVDRVDFAATGWTTHANITVDRITLSESGWDYVNNTSGPVSRFQVIDISDPAGKLVLGATFELPGQVADRWGMDFDQTTGLFRVVTQTGWNQGAALDVFSTPSPGSARQVGHLDLAIPETLTTAAFDGSRAYLVTQHCTDPLWIADTSNPAQPVLQGSVGIPGSLDFVEPRGNRLIALGHDSDTCHFGQAGLAVSLFDVTQPTAPSLLSQVNFGQGYNYVSSNPDDYKKVFQVLDALGLILVPYQSWDYQNWTFTGGTQLVDFSNDSLTLRGFAPHSGSISRAFPVADKLVAMSDRSLQVLDATNRDNPVEVAALDLARPVATLTLVNGYAVELSGDWYRGDTELDVTPAGSPDSAAPIARVKIPAPDSRMFQVGNILWILSHSYANTGESAWLQAVDVSDPTQPLVRGRIDLDPNTVPYWGGWWWNWGWGDEAVVAGKALALHRSFWWYPSNCTNCGTQPQDLVTVVDLSNPDSPRIASTVALPDSNWSWGLKSVGHFAWITHYEWVPDTNYGSVRYYVDRIDLSNPASPTLLPKINVPGVLFNASDDGSTVYTQELVWDSNWSNVTTYFHQLALSPFGTAQLVATASLAGYPGGTAISGGYAYVEASTWSSNSTRTTLGALSLADMTFASTQTVGSQGAWVMKAEAGKLFLSSWWWNNGILIYDLTAPGHPTFQGFTRTEGYVEDVVVSHQTAYLPSGYYGVPMIDLTPGAPLPSY